MRDVGIDDGYVIDHGFGESGGIFWFGVEAEFGLGYFVFAEDCHAVIAFLSFEDVVVACAFEGIMGEIMVLDFCFLDAEDVWFLPG